MSTADATTPPRIHLTRELRAERATFRGFVEQALGPRVRVRVDAEGWPLSPGKYGRLEWRGVEAAGPARGTSRLYAFTDRPRLIARLSAVPGVHRHQVGDQEAAFWMTADDLEAVRQVARLLRLRVRRLSGPATGRPCTTRARDGEHFAAPFSRQDLSTHVPVPRRSTGGRLVTLAVVEAGGLG